MNLTIESFELAKKIMENSLKMNSQDFDTYVKKSINDFITDFDMSVLENRRKVQSFMSHLSSLYLHIMLNGYLYLYGEKEEKLAQQGRLIIINIIEKYRNEI